MKESIIKLVAALGLLVSLVTCAIAQEQILVVPEDEKLECQKFDVWSEGLRPVQYAKYFSLGGTWSVESFPGKLIVPGLVMEIPANKAQSVTIDGRVMRDGYFGNLVEITIDGGELETPYIGIDHPYTIELLEEIREIFLSGYDNIEEVTGCPIGQLPWIAAVNNYSEDGSRLEAYLYIIAFSKNKMAGLFAATADVRGVTGLIYSPILLTRTSALPEFGG